MRALWHSGDARAGSAIAALGLIYLVAAFQIETDPMASSVLGPRVAPIAIGFAALAGAVTLIISGVRGQARTPSDSEQSDERGDVSRRDVSRRDVLITFAMLAAYIVAFIPIGFVLATFCFLAGATTFYERQRVVRNLVFAAGFSVVVYVLFTRGLGVALPPGLLG